MRTKKTVAYHRGGKHASVLDPLIRCVTSVFVDLSCELFVCVCLNILKIIILVVSFIVID